MSKNRTDLLNGISWSAFERFSVQGIQFAVFVLMARMLTPTAYGLVGMLAIFIVISQIFAEGGMSQAIIRKFNRTDTDCSTAFWINIATGIVLYCVLFLCAPWIADFYQEPQLVALLRVMALSVVFQSSLVVHRSLLTSRLDFKTQAKSTLVGALLSGMVGLYMAYHGFGVWALVGLQMVNQFATTLTLWIVSEWRPSLVFSMESFRNLFGFGSKLLISKVVDNLYQSIYPLAIGKIFSAYALGCYTNARQLGSISSENLTKIVQRAAYPMFCDIRRDVDKVRTRIEDYLRLSMFFIAPLMLGLAVLSEPLTVALIGHQWLYTARLLRILCLYFLLFPLNAINFMILEIYGRGTVYLRLQLFDIFCGVVLLGGLLKFGLSAVCCGLVLSAAISYTMNAWIAGKSIRLGVWLQLKAIMPVVVNAAIMASVIFCLQFLIEGEWPKIIIGITLGAMVYCGLSIAFQTRLCQLIVRMFNGRRMRS